MRGISHRRYLWLSSIHDTIIYQQNPIVKPLSTLSLQFLTILKIDKFVANWYQFYGVFFCVFLERAVEIWRIWVGERQGDGTGKGPRGGIELGTLEAQLQHAHGAIVADSNSYELVSFHTIPTDWLGLVVWLWVDLLVYFFFLKIICACTDRIVWTHTKSPPHKIVTFSHEIG